MKYTVLYKADAVSQEPPIFQVEIDAQGFDANEAFIIFWTYGYLGRENIAAFGKGCFISATSVKQEQE